MGNLGDITTFKSIVSAETESGIIKRNQEKLYLFITTFMAGRKNDGCQTNPGRW
ncbi:hypothetical protein [Paenibacillus wynnii]|uniref:hypothetical protein n=1 Tax=Paenibacillus wynnii TaxID=268407 RepID=UPI000B0F0C95|nr:hypothetical protein [Paenibacillus wynnii]